MFRRVISLASLALALALLAGCHHKVENPIANLNSKQPDKVLYDRAMDAMQHGHFEQARLALQTLINTYPDSEFVARAKLSVGDSWYAEGCTSCLAQAELEYKDFQTFFPNMAEAAEAQLKVANIHFKQMEKMDRDPTQALRAEDEYRQLILQYPDSKLVAEAKEKLRMVQEVLAQREFSIGRFYYLRESYPAAIARLESLTQTYPLFSGADEALFMLGTANERWADLMRKNFAKMPGSQAQKDAAINSRLDKAAEAYSQIVTRYPVMDRAGDAKGRLQAMHHPVPTPTPEMIAQNKAEEASRGSTSMFGSWWAMFHHGPNMAAAAGVGEPQMQAPPQVSAVGLVAETTRAFNAAGVSGSNSVGVERVPGGNGNSTGGGNPAAPKGPGASITGQPDTTQPGATTASPLSGTQQTPQKTGIDELTPTAPALAPAANNPGGQPEQPAAAQPAPPPATPAAAQPPQPETPPPGNTVGQSGNQQDQPPAQIQTGVSASEAQAQSGDKNNTDDPKNSSSSRSKKKKKKKVQEQPH
jgi:outer membrane protein assembly factor BamD